MTIVYERMNLSWQESVRKEMKIYFLDNYYHNFIGQYENHVNVDGIINLKRGAGKYHDCFALLGDSISNFKKI